MRCGSARTHDVGQGSYPLWAGFDVGALGSNEVPITSRSSSGWTSEFEHSRAQQWLTSRRRAFEKALQFGANESGPKFLAY